MLRIFAKNIIQSVGSKLNAMLQTYGKWMRENEDYLDWYDCY